MRPWQTWSIFGLSAAVVFAAMAWMSWTVLRLERARERQDLLESNSRLALWRMDSYVSPLVAEESARPYFVYRPFYSAERAYTKHYAQIEKGDVLVPSPLLVQTAPHVVIHFQIDGAGRFTSPQVPTGNMQDLAETEYATHERIEEAARRLAEVEALLRGHEMLRTLKPRKGPRFVKKLPEPPGGGTRGAKDGPDPQGSSSAQRLRSAQEWEARTQSYLNIETQQSVANTVGGTGAPLPGGGMEPVWIRDVLFLVRRVEVEGEDFVQGCRLDWEGLRGELLASVRDLLPEARLERTSSVAPPEGERKLASLPVRLLPGPVPEDVLPLWTPIRVTLATAWACALLAAAAVGLLLRGVISLSERRRVFVSAVTHELRTPLTTFRMYTEMLAGGMLRDEEKRRTYIERLRSEAERLGHLVENVLFYARLESGRTGAPAETCDLAGFVERVREGLAERLERARMELVVETAGDGRPLEVRVDGSALEQIIVNLVDNACKYAASSSERKIHLELSRSGQHALLRVRDHGPGISAPDRRRLFRAFSKSDREAADTAPGVGLGLALSRQLARGIGGDLRLEDDARGGACFVLTLPLAG